MGEAGGQDKTGISKDPGVTIRKAEQQDRKAILTYLGKGIVDCIYMYIDILNYGVFTDNMIVWIQEQDGQLELVVMKYYDSFQVYSHRRGIDVTPVLALLREYPVTMISGRRDIIEQLEEICDDYQASYGAVFDVSFVRRIVRMGTQQKNEATTEAGEKGTLAVTMATEEDAREIAGLICSDAVFRANYDVEKLAEQMAERMRTHTGRSAIIRIDGRIVAHTATFAEAEGIAVLSGLVVLPEYRNCGFIEMLGAYMAEQLGKEDKAAFSFAITPKTIRYHRALYTECGEYGKLVKQTVIHESGE